MRSAASGTTTPRVASPRSSSGGHASVDTQCTNAPQPSGGQDSVGTQCIRAADTSHDQGHHDTHGSNVADAEVVALADALDDLERARIAAEGRVRALRDDKGMAGSHVEARSQELVEGLLALEKLATKNLERAMKRHPLGEFVAATRGLGNKQAGRLLAATGNVETRPNVAKLWQYCGHGDPARSKLRKGQPVEHSPVAKMRTRLVAEKVIQCGNARYREVYDRERAKWADRDTTDGHKHSHALRVVGKEILKDLWREARAKLDAQPNRLSPAPAPEEAIA